MITDEPTRTDDVRTRGVVEFLEKICVRITRNWGDGESRQNEGKGKMRKAANLEKITEKREAGADTDRRVEKGRRGEGERIGG